jgi:hypothetical protein
MEEAIETSSNAAADTCDVALDSTVGVVEADGFGDTEVVQEFEDAAAAFFGDQFESVLEQNDEEQPAPGFELRMQHMGEMFHGDPRGRSDLPLADEFPP